MGRMPTLSVKPAEASSEASISLACRQKVAPLAFCPHCLLKVNLVADRCGRSQPCGNYEAPGTCRLTGTSLCAASVSRSYGEPERTIGGAVPTHPLPKAMQNTVEATCLRSHSCKTRPPPPNLVVVTLPTTLERLYEGVGC